MENNDFGKYLRKLRKEKSLSTHRLAELSGVSQSYIAQVENGRKTNPPSPEILRKIADALNIPYPQLLVAAGYLDEWEYDEEEDQRHQFERLENLYEEKGYRIEFVSNEWEKLIAIYSNDEENRLIQSHIPFNVFLRNGKSLLYNLSHQKERPRLEASEMVIEVIREFIEKLKNPMEEDYIDHFAEQFEEFVEGWEDVSLLDLKNMIYEYDNIDGEEPRPLIGTEEESSYILKLLNLLEKISETEKERDGLRRKLKEANELSKHIIKSDITFNGHQLTDHDKRRILDMLKVLFPEYAPKE
jgi:transcriptional regulator with XRE-family HTH domain